jgi:dTDP-glucose 4,6-dehydratase
LAAAERGRAGRVYNLGGGCERTNLSVVRAILAILGKSHSLIQHVVDRPGHDRRYGIDATRARTELGWAPEIAFDAGLRDTVEWYREHEAWCSAVTASH